MTGLEVVALVAALFAGPAVVTAGTATAWALRRWLRKVPADQIPTSQMGPELEPEPEPELRDLEPEPEPELDLPIPAPVQAPPTPPEPEPLALPRVEATEDDWSEAQKQWEKELHAYDYRLLDVVEELVGHVQFSVQKRKVGHRTVDQREVGIELHEVLYPADDFIVRPIRGQHEWPLLLESEKALPKDLLRMRVLSGEALVRVHAESRVIMEDIHEPDYKTSHPVLYVLWDASPSMFPGYAEWRVPVWKAVILRLMEKALRNQVPFYLRPFGGTVGYIVRIHTHDQAMQFRQWLLDEPTSMSYTDIPKAISVALKDFQDLEYDEGRIVLVTDGEDDSIQARQIRESCEEMNIFLHSIMLGVENGGLRQTSHLYQVVEEDLTVHPPVENL